MDSLAIARDSGVQTLDHRVPPRPGGFTPVGILWHYTATDPRGRNLPTLRVVKDGRADLPGPLCQFLIGRDGTVAVICDGRANHAGRGSSAVLAALRAGRTPPPPSDNRTDGNRWFVGVELEANATSGYTDSQRHAARRLGVSISRALDLPAAAHLGHAEWTSRKIDPGGRWPMAEFRQHITTGLRNRSLKEGLDMTKDELRAVVRAELDRARILDLQGEYGELEQSDDGYGERATKARSNDVIAFLAKVIADEGAQTRKAIDRLAESVDRSTKATERATELAAEAARQAATAASRDSAA
ncbi:MAG: peptidoglycan recognition family protein [Microthrixaceae bacterium]|nr:N-acetylmuramoyl-L-alanine amidase [Microthrixaceae bacterium]